MVKLGGEYLNLTGDNSKDIISIRDDIYKLKDDLQYYLSHIDGGNMTSSFAKEMTDGFGNYSLIRQEADRISARVSDLDGNVANLAVTASEIRSEVSAVDGRVTQLTQTVDGISTRVTTAEGDITALDGRVDTAEGNITTLSGSISTVDQKADQISVNVTNLDDRFTDFQQDVDGWTFKIGDGTTERDISINNGTVDLRDFDVTAKSLSSVASDSSVKIFGGDIAMGVGDFVYDDQIMRISAHRYTGLYDSGTISASDRLYIKADGIIDIGNNDYDSNVLLNINGIPYGNYCQAARSSSASLVANADSLVGMNSLDATSDCFALDGNGGVRCLKKGRVKVWGQIDLTSSGTAGEQCYIFLYYNGSNLNYYTRTTLSGNYTTALFMPRYLSVNQNDVLTFRIHMPRAGTSQGGTNTRMNIEYV